MLCRKKPSVRRRKIRRVFYTILTVILILSVYLEFSVKSQLTDVITVGMKTVAQRAVNATVTEYLAAHPAIGEKLTAPRYGENGTVTAITCDPAAVNALKAEVSEHAQNRIEALAAGEGLSIPLGSFSGFFLLADLGPAIKLKIDSRQTVSCSLKSTFTSAGINQTLHHVILVADVEMVVYNPFRLRRTIRTSADFEIAQTVIVGSVPSYTYGTAGSLW